MKVLYLPESSTIEAANAWAASHGLVALVERGPTGLIRGIAVEPEVAAKMLLARARRLREHVEGLRP